MAGPDPQQLRDALDRFPEPPDDDEFAAADDLLDGAYGRMADD